MIDFIKNKKHFIIVMLVVVLLVGVSFILIFYSRNTIHPTNHSHTNTISPTYDTEELQVVDTTEIFIEEVLNTESEISKPDHVINDTITSSNEEASNTNTYTEETPDVTYHISPSEQAMIDAGYGNVVLLPTGNYGLLMPNPNHLINGKDGGDILIEYLTEKGLQASSVSGSWMNDQHYNWIAKNITELITPNDEEFWD